MKKLFISPPFGNYINHESCTRIRGSFTWEKRGGLIYNTLKSLRPIEGGWVNRIGLRNCGIRNVFVNPFIDMDSIYSIVGIEDGDWEKIYEYLDWLSGIYAEYNLPLSLILEINLGCPNIHEYGIIEEILKLYTMHPNWTICVKIPATDMYLDIVHMSVGVGCDYLHMSNTLPSSRGGISGYQLKKINLPRVGLVHEIYPHTPIIAGGGNYIPDDIYEYKDMGATYFSLSTVWLNFLKARRLIRNVEL